MRLLSNQGHEYALVLVGGETEQASGGSCLGVAISDSSCSVENVCLVAVENAVLDPDKHVGTVGSFVDHRL
jgi:hypothetical protein